ncbi:hypothetical protein [Ancylobacter sp. FA202]|uniref:hypothetical protein n=1 Tax=Ancylobacter sp. FA202 TaxID=1111106 RepID=UPI001FD90206|nr:hypothetical protein [Ancylobacter sp. FA202]
MQNWRVAVVAAAFGLGVLAGGGALAQETKPGDAKPTEAPSATAPAAPTEAAPGDGPYVFAAPPAAQANRLYSVNVRTGEVNACQFERPEGSLVGVTRCFRRDASAQGGAPGRYDIMSTRYSGETGIFRVDAGTGQMSVCYVRDMPKDGGGVEPAVVCTPPSSQ